MSLLNLGVRQLPLRHGDHKGVVGYPYCGTPCKQGVLGYPLLRHLSHFYNINANIFVTSRIKH